MTLALRITKAWQESGSLVCVGIDPIPERIPQVFTQHPAPFLAFVKDIVRKSAPFCCAYKFQFAFFAARGAESELKQAITWLRTEYPEKLVLLDAKRGDIGTTAQAYVVEAFEQYDADIVTVNPYLGNDGIRPFLSDPARGCAVLCRNSNSSAASLQELIVMTPAPMPLYQKVALDALAENKYGNLLLVMGATAPQAIKALRQLEVTLPLLVPGIGEQGGDLAAVLSAGLTATGDGLLISASRSIIYSPDIAAATMELNKRVNRMRREMCVV